MRPDDRWPRWVSQIGLPASRRAFMREDGSEYPNPGPDHFAVAAFLLLASSRPSVQARLELAMPF